MHRRRLITAATALLFPLTAAAAAKPGFIPSYLQTGAASQVSHSVPSTSVSLPGYPNNLVFVTPTLAIGTITNPDKTGSSLFVLDTSSSPPVLKHQLDLSPLAGRYESAILSLSQDGKNLFLPAGAGSGALVLDVDSVLAGGKSNQDLVLSTLDVDATTQAQVPAKIADSCAGSMRLLPSADKKVTWVSCRGSGQLLAFNATALEESTSTDALLASVLVSGQPEDLVFLDDERYILTADSNQYDLPSSTAGLTVVNVEAALAGKQEGFPQIQTESSPSALALSRGESENALLAVSQHEGMTIQVFNVGEILASVEDEDFDPAELRKRTNGDSGSSPAATMMGSSSSSKSKSKSRKKKKKPKTGGSDNDTNDTESSASSLDSARGLVGVTKTLWFGGVMAGLLVFLL